MGIEQLTTYGCDNCKNWLFQGGTSVVVYSVACFGVNLCAVFVR